MPVTRSQQQRSNALANALGPAMNQPTLRRSQRILRQTTNTVEPALVQQAPPPPPPPQQQSIRRSRRLQGLPPTPPPPSSTPRARAPARSPAPSPPSPTSSTPPCIPWPIPLHHPYLPRTHVVARIRQFFMRDGIRHRADYHLSHDPMAEVSNYLAKTNRILVTRQPQPTIEQVHQYHFL